MRAASSVVPGWSRDDLRKRGRDYAREKSLGSALILGYGVPALWNEPVHVAATGHPGAGGPVILAAVKRVVEVESRWYPVVNRDGDTMECRGVGIPLLDLTVAIAARTAVLPESLIALQPATDAYAEWLGFLLVVREHPQGSLCDAPS